jgi:hypothetical protein
MKYVDLILQTALLIWLGIVLLSPSLAWLDVMALQFAFGAWQMLSSFFSIITQSPLFRYKVAHFFLALSYLAVLFIGMHYQWWDSSLTLYKIVLTVPSGSLGLYYYILTWKRVLLSHKKRSSFLPHLNF